MHVCWRDHEIKWFVKLWGLLTEFYSTAECVHGEPAQWCVLNCFVWVLFSFFRRMCQLLAHLLEELFPEKSHRLSVATYDWNIFRLLFSEYFVGTYCCVSVLSWWCFLLRCYLNEQTEIYVWKWCGPVGPRYCWSMLSNWPLRVLLESCGRGIH